MKNIQEEAYETKDVCDQDKVIEFLKEITKENAANNTAILACFDKNQKSKIYSTAITPDSIPSLIKKSENILRFIKEFNNELKIEILELLAIKYDSLTIESIISKNKHYFEEYIVKTVDELIEDGYLEDHHNEIKISPKGWQTYVTLGQLVYNFMEG